MAILETGIRNSDGNSKKRLSDARMNSTETNSYSVKYKDKKHGHVEVKADLCKGCLLCIEACPPGVLVVAKSLNQMGYRPAEYIGERCTGCGVCFYICPEPDSIRVIKRKK